MKSARVTVAHCAPCRLLWSIAAMINLYPYRNIQLLQNSGGYWQAFATVSGAYPDYSSRCYPTAQQALNCLLRQIDDAIANGECES